MDIFCSPCYWLHTHSHTHSLAHAVASPAATALRALLTCPSWHAPLPKCNSIFYRCTRAHTHSSTLYPPSHTPWGCLEDRQQGSWGTRLFKLRLFWVVWDLAGGENRYWRKGRANSLHSLYKSKCVCAWVCDVFLWYSSVYIRPVFFPVPLGKHWRVFSLVYVISPCICCLCTFYVCVCVRTSSLALWTHAGGLVIPRSRQRPWSLPTVMLGWEVGVQQGLILVYLIKGQWHSYTWCTQKSCCFHFITAFTEKWSDLEEGPYLHKLIFTLLTHIQNVFTAKGKKRRLLRFTVTAQRMIHVVQS